MKMKRLAPIVSLLFLLAACRYGSCPPGAVLPNIKLSANAAKQVIVVRVGVKVLSNFNDRGFSSPVLLDAEGKKYISKETILSDSLLEQLRRLKTTGEQLDCEFPFEAPLGIRISGLQYEGVIFDLRLEDGSPKQP